MIGDAGLFELLSPLGFALAAALEGIDVYIYFQGPAVKVLAKGFKPKAHGLMRPFSVFARRGLDRAGHVDPQEKLGELHKLGARFYACGPSMQHYKVGRDDLLFDDVPIVEYFTFMEQMQTADVQFFTQ